MPVRLCSKAFRTGFSSTPENFEMYQLGLEKAEDQIANIPWIIERNSRTSTSVSLTTLKLLIAWITANCGKFLNRWEYQATLPVSWETCMQVKKQVRTRHGTTDWFKIGKCVHQGCLLSPCLFNLYSEYIIQNATLEEAQAGIKIAGRNINNFRYADDTTLVAKWRGNEKEPLDEDERGEWKSWLKTQHSKN